MRILALAAAVAALAGCQANVTAGEPLVVDVRIPRPAWEAGTNFPVPHPWPAADLNGLPAGRVFNLMTIEERKRIQAGLIQTGVLAGKADGKWGPSTWNAVRAYASRTGVSASLLTERGSLDVFRSIAG